MIITQICLVYVIGKVKVRIMAAIISSRWLETEKAAGRGRERTDNTQRADEPKRHMVNIVVARTGH